MRTFEKSFAIQKLSYGWFLTCFVKQFILERQNEYVDSHFAIAMAELDSTLDQLECAINEMKEATEAGPDQERLVEMVLSHFRQNYGT